VNEGGGMLVELLIPVLAPTDDVEFIGLLGDIAEDWTSTLVVVEGINSTLDEVEVVHVVLEVSAVGGDGEVVSRAVLHEVLAVLGGTVVVPFPSDVRVIVH